MKRKKSVVPEDLGRRLAHARKARKLTQRQLAAQLGVCETMVGRYERGFSVPGIRTLQRIPESLGISVEYLATGREPLWVDRAELARLTQRLREDFQALRALLGPWLDGDPLVPFYPSPAEAAGEGTE